MVGDMVVGFGFLVGEGEGGRVFCWVGLFRVAVLWSDVCCRYFSLVAYSKDIMRRGGGYSQWEETGWGYLFFVLRYRS
jgi:hypothetical protein